MNRVIVNLLVIFILCGQAPSFAQQQFPVRTITNVSAPYPVSLEQFTAVENGKISLVIIPNDVKLQNYPIKLKLVISGGWFTIYTNPAFIHRNITLNNGEIQTFSGADLAEWFNPDNLLFDGYSKSQYVKNGRLPEGMYQVWFEVYETNYGYNMSSSTKAMVWIFENDPPLLNFPLNAKEFIATDPQNIVFNWTLRQSPFSVSGASNEYKFELWEIWPDNMNVEEAIRTTRPVYSGTVNSGTFTYSAAEPLLLPGRKYAWRVQAYDPEGKKQYKNNGYSDVRWFRFGKDCGVPAPVLDKATDNTIALKWENDYRFDKYELRWRLKDRQDAKWYTLDGDRQGAVLTKLDPNTQYEIQVHGFCSIQEGEYSPTITARTKEESKCACGTPMGNIDISGQEPLQVLKPGDYFRASDFDVQVYQVSGANGTFSGKGFVSVPLLKSIKFEAEFKSVKINNNYRMYDGEVKFIYNQKNGITVNIGQLLNSLTNRPNTANETNPFTEIIDRKAKVDTTISSIIVRSTGEILVTKSDGRTEVIRASQDDKLVAISGKTDGSEQYVVDTKTGTLYKATPDKRSNANTTPLSPNKPGKYNVTFAAHNNQIYGLDLPGENTVVAKYDKANLNGTEKEIPWKSVETGKIDQLVARVEGGPVDSVHYLTGSNNMVMVAPGTEKNTSQLLVTGIEKNDELKAWYSEKINDTTENRILAAQLNIIAYDKKLINLCLVEVNGAAAPDANFAEKELNTIYASAVVQWKVKKVQGFKVTITDLENGKFVNKRSDDDMNYTDHEKQVRDAFIKTKDYDKNTVYLFFIGGNTTHELQGFMPFNRQFGFIFTEHTNAFNVIRTIAHEAGHGAFRLKHPFEASDPRMATDNNLMAYSQFTMLYKTQWDECHDKDLGLNWFEDGEEGEATSNSEVRPRKVAFEETKFPDYAFDANTYNECKNYPTFKDQNDLEDGSPWLYVFENTQDTINANVRPDKAKDKVTLDTDITATIINNTSNPISISILSPSELNYFVVAKDTLGEDKTLGGINIISQPLSLKREFTVKLYLLKGPLERNYPTIDEAEIKSKLSSIYSVCGANFTISTIKKNLKLSIDTNKNGYFDEYDMKEKMLLNQAMTRLAVTGEISVFVLNTKIQSKNASGNTIEINGYAPLNNNYPSMLTNPYVVLSGQNSNQGETLSHEIGHCVFGLQHPFDEFSSQTRSQDPQNIMDYGRTDGSCWLRAYQILKINQLEVLRLWKGR